MGLNSRLQVQDAAEQLCQGSFVQRGAVVVPAGGAIELPGPHTLTIKEADIEAFQLILALSQNIYTLTCVQDLH